MASSDTGAITETENDTTNVVENSELILFQVKECYVYKIPPRKTAASYRADEWDINKWAWEGSLRVVSRGEECFIKLEDSKTGELFAVAPVYQGQPLPVEAVIDSSRFFVLRIEDTSGAGERHAFIGVGFRERPQAYDFQAALHDHVTYLNRKKEADEMEQVYNSKPAADYSLKEGQMLHLDIKTTPLHVPLEINIVLVGFNGDGGYRYKVDSEELRWFMQRSFPSHRPTCQETGHELEIEHDLTYTVLPVGGMELQVLEKEVRNHMVRNNAASSPGRAYTVEGTQVEGVFDRFYSYLFGQDSTASSEKDLERPAPAAVFIFNFDKVRMDPEGNTYKADGDLPSEVPMRPLSEQDLAQQESNYTYSYTYNGGAQTQVWVSHGRYAVIDLSAGPCTYGQLASEEGSVGPATLPRVRSLVLAETAQKTPAAKAKRERTAKDGAQKGGDTGGSDGQAFFHGSVSALLVSAIEHLFSPDVKRMVQPEQELVVVDGVHSLHDHERLAMAVTRAVQSQTLHEPLPGGGHAPRTRTFLDGAFLVEEMRHSADMLAAGILDVAHPVLSDSFFDPLVPVHDREQMIDDAPLKKAPPKKRTILPVKKDWQPREGGGKRRWARQRREKFVLSLAGVDGEMLMEGESPLFVVHDAVIVLQTSNDSVPLRCRQLFLRACAGAPELLVTSPPPGGGICHLAPSRCCRALPSVTPALTQPLPSSSSPRRALRSYVSESRRCTAAPSQPQRAVVAGVAAVLGGLAAPYEKLAPRFHEVRQDWLWAAGHHPFGPFSNTSSLSLLLHDTILRNAIYSRVDTALHGVRQSLVLSLMTEKENGRRCPAVKKPLLRPHSQQGLAMLEVWSNSNHIPDISRQPAIEEFSDRFLHTPFGDPVASSSGPRTAGMQWLDKLYRDPHKLAHPLPHGIVEKLEKNLEEIEEHLVQISQHLYDHQLKEGHSLSLFLLQFRSEDWSLALSECLLGLLWFIRCSLPRPLRCPLLFYRYTQTELTTARDDMRCCRLEYKRPPRSQQALLYAGILIAGFLVYSLVIFFSSPER
eukprot:jgi/Mesen1/7909/ME000420S07051